MNVLVIVIVAVVTLSLTPDEPDGRVSTPVKSSLSSFLLSSIMGTITICEFTEGAKVTECEVIV